MPWSENVYLDPEDDPDVKHGDAMQIRHSQWKDQNDEKYNKYFYDHMARVGLSLSGAFSFFYNENYDIRIRQHMKYEKMENAIKTLNIGEGLWFWWDSQKQEFDFNKTENNNE